MTEVTDPNILQQLNSGPKEVTDPGLLMQLNGEPPRPSFQYNVGTWDKFINDMPNMPDALRKKANNAIAIAATHDIDPAQAMDLEPGFTAHYKNDNLGETAVKSFKRGLGNTYSSIGQTLKWAGMDGQVADDYVEYGERLKRAYLPPEPPKEFSFWRDIKDPVFWATRIPETLPTSLALIPAAVIGAYGGAGAGAMMGLGLFGRTILGAIGGAALSRPVESAFEAGGTYEEALSRGVSEDEARMMADSTYSRNLALGGLDAAQFALAFTPLRFAGNAATKTLSRRILASIGAVGAVALSEGGEERYQELIQVESLGGDASFFDFNDTRLNEATTIGAVFGLGMAGTGSVFKALTNEITKAMPPELKQTYDLEKTKALNAGSEEASAQIQALDVVAGIPDGKTHIEQVVADLKARAENTGNRAAEDVPGFAPPMDEARVDAVIDRLLQTDQITNEGVNSLIESMNMDNGTFSLDNQQIREQDLAVEGRKAAYNPNQGQLDLEGQQDGLPAERGKDLSTGGTAPLRADTAVPVTTPDVTPEGQPRSVLPVVENRQVTSAGFHKATIESTADAAEFARDNLVDEPQEVMVAIVLDKDNKPISILRHTVGVVNSSQVSPGILAGAIIDTPGAASTYLAHNHPSGNAKLSAADVAVYKNMAILLRDSGVRMSGSFAVGPTAYGISEGEALSLSGKQPPQYSFPVTERKFKTRAFGQTTVAGEQDVLSYAKANNLPADKTAVLLLDAQNAILDVIHIPDLNNLRGEGIGSGILGNIHRRNAVGAIFFRGDRQLSPGEHSNAKGFAKAAGITLIDIIDGAGSHVNRRAFEDVAPEFYDITSIFTPELWQKMLSAWKADYELARPHLENLGNRIYSSGANTLEAWQAKMEEFLGDLWDNFKSHMADIWEAVRQFNAQLGQRGSIGADIRAALDEDPLRQAIKEIKEQGGINLESLRHRRQKGEAKKLVASTYSQEQVTELTKKHPGLVSKKGKATLDEIADQYGFDGGDELLQSLLGMESKAKAAKKAQGNLSEQIRDDAALAKKGYEVGRGEIESYMLDLGDKLVIDGEEHVVSAIDENDGTLTLKNGTIVRVAADEMVPYTAIKKNKIDTAAANEKLLRDTRLAMAETARVDRNVKAKMRRATGQYTDANMVREDVALREVLRKSAQAAQIAFRAGNAEGVATEKAKMKEALIKIKANNDTKLNMIMTERQKIQDRREFITSLRDGLGLTDAEMKGLTKKNVLFMTDAEFNQFQDDLLLRAAELAKTKLAKMKLMQTITEKRLRRVENYREALKLPTIDKMTRAELEQFNELLKPFHDEDVFYTQRQLEMVDRTEKLKGTRTIREARDVLAREYTRMTGEKVDAGGLVPVHSESLNMFRWDTVLSEQEPFFQVLVTRMTEAMLLSDIRFRDVERQVTKLAKAAHSSRPRTLIEKAIPQDERIIDYLEAKPAEKSSYAQALTEEELAYAGYVQEYYGQALDYLIKTDALKRGIRDYYNHTRRSFLEVWKGEGLKEAVLNIFDNLRQDEAVFTILDGDTGNILPLEKFFANTLHRTGVLIPSENLTRAFETYVKSFERKVAFDAIMDELAIFTDSLTPEGLTPRGLEVDRSLKTFVNQYINNKKGRHIGFDGTLRQGGEIDSIITGLKTFISMVDLGLNVPMQLVNIIGEQAAQFIEMGPKLQALGTKRMMTEHGKAILEKYEAFTGVSLWDKFTQPGREVQQRLMDIVFAGYHVTTVASNKQFLLGMMTEEEYKAGELAPERLAEMKIEMGRWRVISGTESLAGSTSLGGAVTQYKKWVIVMGQRTVKDIKTLVKDLKLRPAGEVLTTKEAKEVYRMIGLAATVLIVGVATGADDNDKSYIGKFKNRMYKESLSQMQAISPKLWLSTPRLAVWLANLGANVQSLIFLEEFKNDHRLKGWEGLKKQITPAPIRQLQDDRR